MNQPDLGIKVAELRQTKGFTQEQLAERCEVSPRTIQRIESGEVDPRAYTLQCLGTALAFDFGGEGPANESLWLTVLHLSSMLCIFIIPLLLWSWMKNRSVRIDRQGRKVLNFQITMMLLNFGAAFLLMLFPMVIYLGSEEAVQGLMNSPAIAISTLLLPAPLILIGIFCTVQGAVNAMRALADKPIHYPLSIPFVK
jgi:uncharacterized Tic20 family protein/DNA-binding XRE family transcriptional regulator